MRVLIASDLHGSFGAAKLLAKLFACERADSLFLLGDLLAGRVGPDRDGDAVAALLNVLASRITAVRGNCDSAFDERKLRFSLPDYVYTEIGARRVLLTHGHCYGEGRLPAAELPELICQGHTHVALLKRRNGYTLLNPGSVTDPRSGAASYAVVDETTAVLKTTDGAVLESSAW